MAFIATKLKVSIQSALAAAVTATAVTQANPGVVTAAGHGLTTGDTIVWGEVSGMAELSYQAVRVTVTSVDEFSMDGLDTTNYTAFVSGTFQQVTTFVPLSNSTSVSMPDAGQQKIDVSTLLDTSMQYDLGVPDSPEGSISGLFAPNILGVQEVRAAQRTNTARVLKLEWQNGALTLFNAFVSGGQGFEAAFNQAVTGTISFTPRKEWFTYAAV